MMSWAYWVMGSNDRDSTIKTRRVLHDRHLICDGAWQGQPAFILGGGPSINVHGFRISDIQSKGKIIVTNRALALPVFPDLWVWMDHGMKNAILSGVLGEYVRIRFHEYPGPCITRINIHKPQVLGDDEKIFAIGFRHGVGLGPTFHKAYMSNNTGHWALNLAYCLGADPIILFGFDLQGGPNNKQVWWHDGYAFDPRVGQDVYAPMKERFEALADDLNKERTVWNCSPGTALGCFEVVGSLDTLFERLDEWKSPVPTAISHTS